MLDFFFFQAEDGIRDIGVTGVQTCALPICPSGGPSGRGRGRSGGASGARPRWGGRRRRGSSARRRGACGPGTGGRRGDRESGVLGKSGDLGGRRNLKKK